MTAVCLFGLLAVILAKVSAEIAPKFRPFFAIGSGVVLFLAFFRFLSPVLTELERIFAEGSLNVPYRLVIKGVGISLLVGISASFCRDMGEGSVAEKLELCGKGAVLALSLPILAEIIKMIGEISS